MHVVTLLSTSTLATSTSFAVQFRSVARRSAGHIVAGYGAAAGAAEIEPRMQPSAKMLRHIPDIMAVRLRTDACSPPFPTRGNARKKQLQPTATFAPASFMACVSARKRDRLVVRGDRS